jgi:hypothetical protein
MTSVAYEIYTVITVHRHNRRSPLRSTAKMGDPIGMKLYTAVLKGISGDLIAALL